jgi:hypothetical protein
MPALSRRTRKQDIANVFFIGTSNERRRSEMFCRFEYFILFVWVHYSFSDGLKSFVFPR